MMKLMNKKLTKKGFTLAELLIVVAILAILVAVSIPIFTSKLHDAKDSTDMANARAAKGAAPNIHIQDTVSVSRCGFSRKYSPMATAHARTEKMNCLTDNPKNIDSV